MGVTKLNFNDTLRRIPQKSIPQKLLSTGFNMIKLQVTNPEYSGVWGYPYKYLPVMYITNDERHEYRGGQEGIVMPKGTIVSFMTCNTKIATGVDAYVNAQLIPPSGATGEIPQFIDQLNAGDIVFSPIDDKYFGYQESVVALMVPANGGSPATYKYSTLDDETDGWSVNGDTNLVLGGNKPMGIVLEHVYQDIRGKYLNYQTHDAYSTIITGRLDVPYVDTTIMTAFGDDTDPFTDGGDAYYDLWRKWQFYRFASGSDYGQSGTLLKSDKFGKFIPMGSVNRTDQTVGKLLTLDCRFPKDLSAQIQNYPGAVALGTITSGVPVDLYLFTIEVLKAEGITSPTSAQVLDAVQSGAVGYARIQLLM